MIFAIFIFFPPVSLCVDCRNLFFFLFRYKNLRLFVSHIPPFAEGEVVSPYSAETVSPQESYFVTPRPEKPLNFVVFSFRQRNYAAFLALSFNLARLCRVSVPKRKSALYRFSVLFVVFVRRLEIIFLFDVFFWR